MNLKPRRHEDPEISLISLIDVVLMIVIFFMISSEFTVEGRVRLQLPEASGAPAQRSAKPIVVTVTQSGGYLLDGRELINSSPETLSAALVKLAGRERNQPITLRADARTTHQSVVTAMDVLGRLGFSEIDIATVNAQPPAPAQ